MYYKIKTISSKHTQTGSESITDTPYQSFDTPYVNQKEERSYSMLESSIALAIVVISFVYLRLGGIFWQSNSCVFYCLALMAADITYLSFKTHKIRPFHIVLFMLIIIFNVAYVISSVGLVKMLASSFSTLLLFYSVFIVIGDRKPLSDTFPKEIMAVIFSLPFKKFGSFFGAITHPIKKNSNGKNIKGMLLGLVFAIPITLIIMSLLMSADNTFSAIFDKIIPQDTGDFFTIIFQIGVAVLFTCYLFGLLISSGDKHDIAINDTRNGLPSITLYTAVTPICIMYVIFFFVSLGYFTSALMGKLPVNYSYSEYARQGFFELCAVSAINLGIIIGLNSFCHKENGEKPKGIRFFTVFIILASLTHIITAISKMVLYISEKGLTHLRVYTSWFMALLFMTFICILIKTFRKNFKMYVSMFCIFTLMLGILCFSNLDYRIADFNINGYINGDINELDMYNIKYNLSDTAILAAVKYTDNDKVSEQMHNYLDNISLDYYDDGISYFNFESYAAKKALEEYRETVNEKS